MKFTIIALLALSFSAMAQDQEVLAKAKQMMSSNIDERIAILQETKSCINSASSKEQLKNCRQQMKSKMKGFKEELKQDRAELKSAFDKAKQERKDKKKNP